MKQLLILIALLCICGAGCTKTIVQDNAQSYPDNIPELTPQVEIILEETLILGVESSSLDLAPNSLVDILDEPVPLAASLPNAPVMNQVFARLNYADCNLAADVYYGLTPQVLDVLKGVGLWVQPHAIYNAMPGEGKISVYGGHNYYEFAKLANAKLEDVFDIATSGNIFKYRVILADFGEWDQQANIIVNGTPVIDWKFSNSKEQVILYTCYPFTQVVTNQRFVVIGELMDIQDIS